MFGVIDDVSGAAAAIGTLDKTSTELAVDQIDTVSGSSGRIDQPSATW